MSAELVQILYVGNAIAGQTFKECMQALGWEVYLAKSRYQALGLYITYMPDLVILNALTNTALAEDVHYHIRTVESTPIIVLGTQWDADDYATHLVSPYTPLSKLVFLAHELIEGQSIAQYSKGA